MSREELAEWAFIIVAVLLIMPAAFRFWATWYMVVLLAVLGGMVWMTVRRWRRMQRAIRRAEEEGGAEPASVDKLFRGG